MNKIKVLSEETIKRISAGEIIERPVSVTKELIENSIDAQATEIFVEIKQGGKKLIKVKDNGLGMNKEDIILCIDRHTTSKISSMDDVYKIKTLGFRGEALSSMAAVSRLEIRSIDNDSKIGAKLTVINGKKKLEKCAFPRGTMVAVADIFYNIPVRLKFLKSIETEASHIYNLIFKLAIANNNISFKLEVDGRSSLNVLAVKTLKERLYELFGKEFVDNLMEIKFKNEEVEIFGYIGKPDFTKPTKNSQYIFVNNRLVVDKSISHAISSGYEALVPHNRFPVCILFVNINPSKIDINIHPTKREIKFMNTNLVYNSIMNAVQEILRKEKPLPKIFPEAEAEAIKGHIPFGCVPIINEYNYKVLETRTNTIGELMQNYQTESKVVPIIQIKSMYILAESKDGIYIIDQHVAHEKVIYEKLSKHSEDKSNPRVGKTQYFLVPISLKLNFSQSSILDKSLNDLLDLGFDIENFGKNTFLLRGTPEFLKDTNVEKMLVEIIDTLSEDIVSNNLVKDGKENLLRSIACHSAVRAGDKLTYEEMSRLVNEFLNCDLQYCPHGRPGLIKINFDEIDRKFKRC
ncbi:MAG: DNA mismatch repair endonuclease MutL [Candidatus Firestonebacteria bacterium]